MIYISSNSNPYIKNIKKLYKRKERWAQQSFLIEGIKIVEESIGNSYPIDGIIFCEKLFESEAGLRLWKKIEDYDNLIKLTNKLFNEVSNMEKPQGIMAIAKIKEYSMNNIYKNKNPFLLFLDQLQDPGNMGTIIRTGDAFGIHGIIISEASVDVYNPKVVQATMGSIFRMPVYHIENKVKILKEFRARGIKIFSTSLNANKYIDQLDFRGPMALVIGNESKGVSSVVEGYANRLIKIPMIGEAESLNAAIATSIIMYEATKQRGQKFL